EVALDQTPLGGLVSHVLATGELTLFDRRQKTPVTDLAHVELERVGRERRDGVVRILLLDLGLVELRRVGNDFELGLRGGVVFGRTLRKRPGHRAVYRSPGGVA